MSTAARLSPEILWSLDEIEWTLFFLGDEPPDVASQIALPVACDAPEAGEEAHAGWAPRPSLPDVATEAAEQAILAAYGYGSAGA